MAEAVGSCQPDRQAGQGALGGAAASPGPQPATPALYYSGSPLDHGAGPGHSPEHLHLSQPLIPSPASRIQDSLRPGD